VFAHWNDSNAKCMQLEVSASRYDLWRASSCSCADMSFWHFLGGSVTSVWVAFVVVSLFSLVTFRLLILYSSEVTQMSSDSSVSYWLGYGLDVSGVSVHSRQGHTFFLISTATRPALGLLSNGYRGFPSGKTGGTWSWTLTSAQSRD
jgi:hypothetical protein